MPELTPTLTFDVEPGQGERPRAVALVLHGGRSRSTAPVRAGQLAVLRMKPFATALARAGEAHGLAVARLRYRVRGWNGEHRDPVMDTEWALERLAQRYPDVPVGLVGHSMGGRTALYTGGFPTVRSVAGLAPWLEPGDPTAQLAGRHVLLVHGDGDRMTSPDNSLDYARDLRGTAASIGYVSLRGAKHAMLQRAGLWHRLATGFTLAALLDLTPRETVGEETANILEEASAGSSPVVV